MSMPLRVGQHLRLCRWLSVWCPSTPWSLVAVVWVVSLRRLCGLGLRRLRGLRLVGLRLRPASGLVARLGGLWHLGLQVWRPSAFCFWLGGLLCFPSRCFFRGPAVQQSILRLRFRCLLSCPFGVLVGGSLGPIRPFGGFRWSLRIAPHCFLRRRFGCGLAFDVGSAGCWSWSLGSSAAF